MATCNGCPIVDGSLTHVAFRAIGSSDKLATGNFYPSTIGIATTKDGDHFGDHSQIIIPEHEWEKYGCEDPRVTKFGDTYYIFYTALGTFPFSADGIRVGVALSKDLKTIDEKHLVTPFNAKAMALFPEKIEGKMVAILTADTDKPPAKIAIAEFEKAEDLWSQDYWADWYNNKESFTLPLKRGDNDHVEVGAPPIKTKEGWLVIYSYIQNYFSGKKIFGIEAVLLDLKDPKKILCRTAGPMMVPEEIYERYGYVPDVVFPTGAHVRGDRLYVYYGASDTTTCRASAPLQNILDAIRPETRMREVKRFANNPILVPNSSHSWESKNVFNPGAIEIDGTTYLFYRAMSGDGASTIGLATSENGKKFKRLDTPIYVPREEFEMKKGDSQGNSGCEDPRITKIGGRLYMLYTAYNGVDVPRVAISSLSVSDLKKRSWNWSKPKLLTPSGVDDKDACLLAEKVRGKFMIFHRIESHVCADILDTLEFENEVIDTCIDVFGPRPGMWDSLKVGITAPPILTKRGWVLLYHGVSDSHVYRIGAALLKRDDPTSVLARTSEPIFEPQEKYELMGEVPNVVFPCGAILRDNIIYIYYGAGDHVVGGAEVSLDYLFKIFE